MQEIADGIWWWTARHPEWHPRTPFGAKVASYALRGDHETLLVDPLAPDGDADALIAALAPALSERILIVLTIPYHVRSSEPIWERLRDAHETTIHGHPAVAKRLRDTSGFREMYGGVALRSGTVPIHIGNPRRHETPLFVPEHRALVLGDAIVETEGALRVWLQQPLTPSRRTWYATRLRPSLAPLLDFDVERVLVTHGQPVLSGGQTALVAALDSEPWYHRPN